MAKPADFALDADEIVSAALDIFEEQGLDAVSMRSVAARLGVSPVPLYSRVGNKEALVAAIADRLLTALAPPVEPGETWSDYAWRWSQQLRVRLRRARDSRLILTTDRTAFLEASRPLIAAMRDAGFAADAAVQGCRLITWATVGFVAMESGAQPPPSARSGRRHRSGGDPAGVTRAESDELFALQMRYVIDGVARDAHTGAQPTTTKRGSKR